MNLREEILWSTLEAIGGKRAFWIGPNEYIFFGDQKLEIPEIFTFTLAVNFPYSSEIKN